MLLVGIDPGLSGALAFYNLTDGSLPAVYDMPTMNVGAGGKRVVSEYDLARIVKSHNTVAAYLEKVGTRPGEGAVGAFSFGAGYGMIRGVLAGCGVPIFDVTPQTWKRHFGIPSGASKDASRKLARQVFPNTTLFDRVKDDGRAEASLIATYGAGKWLELKHTS